MEFETQKRKKKEKVKVEEDYKYIFVKWINRRKENPRKMFNML